MVQGGERKVKRMWAIRRASASRPFGLIGGHQRLALSSSSSSPAATGTGISFHLTPEQAELEARVSEFVRKDVIPYEKDPRRTHHGPTDELRTELVNLAKKKGLVGTEQIKKALHSHSTRAVFFEAAGYSVLGPIALNIAAPDEGNMHLLDIIATPAQRKEYLNPMLDGSIRSCFMMTEPGDGCGSDPSALKTTARQTSDGKGWVIDGEKWLITGSSGAKFAIIMAKTLDKTGKDIGASMFLANMSDPAIKHIRVLDTMDSTFTGGHGHLSLKGLRVSNEAVLGEAGKGFQYAQVRLAPARLTHCMRWLGAAKRAHDTAVAYTKQRQSFGKKLIEHQGVSFQLADNEMDLLTTRLHVRYAAWILDQGKKGTLESSIAKVSCSEAIFRVVDRSLQVLGGIGATYDTEVQCIFRDVRAFRIYDGSNEVHRMSIGRSLARPPKPAAAKA